MQNIKTLADLVTFFGKTYGEKIALQIKEETEYRKISYKNLSEQIKKISNFLQNCQIDKGARAVILSENRPEWGISYLGIICAGAISVPLDPALKPEELLVLINDCLPEFIFTSDKFIETAEILCKNCSFLKHIINFDSIKNSEKVISFKTIQDTSFDTPSPIKIDPEDIAVIVYTSGTTGNPKGVMLTHKNLVFELEAIPKIIKIDSSDRTLSVLPLHHTFECTTDFLLPLSVGAQITYLQSLKSTKILEAMQETKTTILVGVPLLFQFIYNGVFQEIKNFNLFLKTFFWIFWFFSGILPFSFLRKKFFKKLHNKFGGHLRFFVSGGAAIDLKILLGFKRMGIEIIQGYGLTEAAPVVSANTLNKNILGSIGKPLPGIEVKINQPDKNGIGELIIKGPNVMKGYFQKPELTEQVLKNGWLYTGDLAKIDKNGYLYIVGRIKDVIISSSGQNVYPDEIEMQLGRNPEIAEICVFGKINKTSSKFINEEVFAIIRPNENFFGEITEENKPQVIQKIKTLINNYNRSCATFKRIENFKIVFSELPKTSTRKIKRNLVKKIWEELK